jgi:hypothetical protein
VASLFPNLNVEKPPANPISGRLIPLEVTVRSIKEVSVKANLLAAGGGLCVIRLYARKVYWRVPFHWGLEDEQPGANDDCD